jgi:ABC-2 type transport system ATP-binding protein
MPDIEVTKASKRYGSLNALDGVNLTVEKGEFFGFLGPNGAGKSTLLKILTGQLRQDSGSVSVLGIDNEKQISLKGRIGVVPEAETPSSFLTAREFLELVGRIRGISDSAGKVDSWLDFFELSGRSNVLCKDLSKGQRQKVMLASAFIHEPGLLFLDEPFINLDPIFQRKVRNYLLERNEKGVTIFMCTHILEIAEKICSRVALINNGKVVGEGTVPELVGIDNDDLESVFMKMVEEMSDDG